MHVAFVVVRLRGGPNNNKTRYIYNRRIVVPREYNSRHAAATAGATCVFRAKTQCSIFFLHARLRARPSAFGGTAATSDAGASAGAGASSLLPGEQGHGHDHDQRRSSDNNNADPSSDMVFDLSDGDQGMLCVSELRE